MEWTRDIRHKLARHIRELSLKIQTEEFSKKGIFPDMVERTIGRIMERLEPLGFESANKDWVHEDGLYKDSPTHLWFEIAQCRIVKIRKDLAEKLLVLGFP